VSAAPRGESTSEAPAPYRGPDRRGVARFVVPARPPTLILLAVAVVVLILGDALAIRPTEGALIELEAVAATLALLGGVACILRWRLDGIARGWWCGWALLVMGAGQLALQPVHGVAVLSVEVAMVVVGAVLFGRAIYGPEVDATIRPFGTALVVLVGAGIALVPALLVTEPGRADAARAVIGGLWLLVGAGAVVRTMRERREEEAGWIIPVAVALALAELVPLGLDLPGQRAFVDRSFELMAMAMACVAALGGLVRAAVHHRTRALRERIEHDKEVANRERVEASFADRLHEMRSTVVAIEGGVATLPDGTVDAGESTLRAALIAEIRRLRTLVNESPAAAGVEPFDVAAAIAPTVELQRRNGMTITFVSDELGTAVGRGDEIAQVVHGLLANAAKYAPGCPVEVRVSSELDEVAIRVADGGPGIDPEYWDLVFERGFRVDPDSAPGSGLGLAVARDLVRSQDGDLWVEDGPAGGAAFVISIPAAPALRVVPEPAEAPGGAIPAPAPHAPSIEIQEVR
jgi:signal transduction histidine kinase